MNDDGKILIVDDDEAIARLLSEILRSEGFSTRECLSGPAALEALAQDDFQLVLLDIMMPGMNGFETCQRIRENSDVPVVFLTAKNEESDLVLGFSLGADDYIVKPFKPRADLLLDTTHTYEVCLWHALLDTMPPDEDLTATQRRQLDTLRARFAAFPPLDTALVPADSMLREFIGA